MSTTPALLKPMDIYSDMQVPFDVAVFCRGHKFNVAAVALTKAIQERDKARLAVLAAEKWLEGSERALAQAVDAARTRMQESTNV